MIVPLAIVVTLRPTRHLTASQGIDELFVDERQRRRLTPDNNPPWFWKMFFMGIDRGPALPHRRYPSTHALKACEEWMLKRASQDDPAPTEGLGAIFPSMVYLQIALKKLGRLRTDPVIQRAEKDLDDFFLIRENGESIKIQPCLSPVWDTGIHLLPDRGGPRSDGSIREPLRTVVVQGMQIQGRLVKKVQATEEMSSWFSNMRMPVSGCRRYGDGLHGSASPEEGQP